MAVSASRALELNVAAGKLQVTILELMVDSVPAELLEDEQKHFKDRLALMLFASLERLTRDIRPEPESHWIKPMSDEESFKFERELFPFGKHTNRSISEVVNTDPQYLQWFASQSDNFKKDLNRYLARYKD